MDVMLHNETGISGDPDVCSVVLQEKEEEESEHKQQLSYLSSSVWPGSKAYEDLQLVNP